MAHRIHLIRGHGGQTNPSGGATVGPAFKLAFFTQPSNVAVSVIMSPAVLVQIQDANSNPVTTSTAVVTLSLTTGPGALGGTVVVTAASGIATFGALTVNTAGAGDQMTASSPGLVPRVSTSFTVSGGGSIWLLEDFSTYSNTADWLADPRGIYSVAEDESTGQMTLETSVGVTIDGYSLSKSARYDYPAPACISQTVERNIVFPSETQNIWFELYCKWSTNFTTKNSDGCPTPPDFKMFFLRSNAGLGRGAVRWGSQDPPQISVEILTAVDILTGTAISGYCDNLWHRLRGHWTINGAASLIHLDIDGTTIYHNASLNCGSSTATFYGASLGRNLDQGVPTGTMSQWWGRFAIWISDPAWGF
jgi:hypothetical protein